MVNIVPGLFCEFVHRGQGVRFFVRNVADSIQNVHTMGSFYEVPELRIIERYVKPNGCFLDVGANVGNHAIYVAKFCAQREIIVIEPTPQAIFLLRLNLLLNQLNLDTSHLGVGLSDREQMAEAVIPLHNLGGTRLDPTDGGSLKLVTGDSLFEGRQIDFIKIDVEGGELQVLAGLERTIAACRPSMFIEVDDDNQEAFAAWLDEHRYRVIQRFRRYKVNENYMVAPEEREVPAGEPDASMV